MNPNCPNCRASGKDVVKFGSYFRRGDSRHISRFRCARNRGGCGRCFSNATLTATYRQKKRRINAPLRKLLGSNLSQRRAAILLNVSRTTIARRLPWLAGQANQRQQCRLEKMPSVEKVQFDDLITIEHTKLKPLSVTVVVDPERWQILGLCVAQIPCSGLLAKKSRDKYGKRTDKSREARRQLFEELGPTFSPSVEFVTDEHRDYSALIKQQFPSATHTTHKSVRGCVSGQGELKRTGFDPLFCINQTLAMLRANINRLIRRTWCTTKKPEHLLEHLVVFMDYYNEVLSPGKSSQPCSTTN